jgi:ornithine carbamoyltransferase
MVALIFEKPSTRTRVSFDVGVRQMGGQTMVLSGSEMQLGHGETIADTARVLSRYVDLIMIRTFEEDVLLELADYATVPVINGLTNRTHPCQIMADVMTYEEHRGPIAGKKVVWCGDGNNVFASFAHAAGQFGFDLTFSGPETLDPEQVFLDEARAKGSTITIDRDPMRAVEGADLVVTDTWVSMHDSQSATRTPPQPAAPLPGERGADGPRQARRALHALPARASRRRGDERRHGRPPFGGLRRGGKPAPRAEGDPALVPRCLTPTGAARAAILFMVGPPPSSPARR